MAERLGAARDFELVGESAPIERSGQRSSLFSKVDFAGRVSRRGKSGTTRLANIGFGATTGAGGSARRKFVDRRGLRASSGSWSWQVAVEVVSGSWSWSRVVVEVGGRGRASRSRW